MPDAHQLLEEYVLSGKLMQLATLNADGSPTICNVWYDAHFSPDVLRFISQHDRYHSDNIRRRPRVAGSIVAIPIEQLGQIVRGVTFRGMARELPSIGVTDEASAFIRRWPAAKAAVEPGRLARGETSTRIYEVAVAEWVLFDEANSRERPRQTVRAV